LPGNTYNSRWRLGLWSPAKRNYKIAGSPILGDDKENADCIRKLEPDTTGRVPVSTSKSTRLNFWSLAKRNYKIAGSPVLEKGRELGSTQGCLKSSAWTSSVSFYETEVRQFSAVSLHRKTSALRPASSEHREKSEIRSNNLRLNLLRESCLRNEFVYLSTAAVFELADR
jgi:hypothetical protein